MRQGAPGKVKLIIANPVTCVCVCVCVCDQKYLNIFEQLVMLKLENLLQQHKLKLEQYREGQHLGKNDVQI